MKARMITGGVLCAIIGIALFWLRRYSVYIADALVLFFALGGTLEMARAMRRGRGECVGRDVCPEGTCAAEPMRGTGCIVWLPVACVILSFGLFLWLGDRGIILAVLLSAAVALGIVTFDERINLIDLCDTLACLVYPGMFLSLFYVINHNENYGMYLLTLVLGSSIMVDSCALFVGMTLKGPKLCPRISPKKTISGAVGGVLGGIAGAFIPYILYTVLGVFEGVPNVGRLALSDNNTVCILLTIAIGLVAGVANQVGDLAASIIKRKVGIKDYSHIFPGHGGVMDRMDGMSFVLVVVYVFVVVLGL